MIIIKGKKRNVLVNEDSFKDLINIINEEKVIVYFNDGAKHVYDEVIDIEMH